MDKYTNANPLTVRPSSHAKWIEGARDGNVIAAQALMSDAATCLQHGMPLPELLANYIGKALYSSSLKPDDISQAFNLKRGRGKNKHDARFHTLLLCLEVRLASFDIGRYNNTSAGTGAYQAVADNYDLSEGYVRNLFEANHKEWHLKEESREDVEAILPIYRKMFSK